MVRVEYGEWVGGASDHYIPRGVGSRRKCQQPRARRRQEIVSGQQEI